MLLRPTTAADFPAVAALTNHFILHTSTHFGYEAMTPQDFEQQWLSTRETYPWLTAEVDGAFAGYAKASTWRSRTAYQWTAEAGIYVEASARRAGVGKALYRALIDELRHRGFHSVVGGVTLPNEASVRLHESLGFTFVGSFKHAGHKFNQWHDVGFWQLMLRDATHQPIPIPGTT
jgi:phosphinothricin acetyltransferase